MRLQQINKSLLVLGSRCMQITACTQPPKVR